MLAIQSRGYFTLMFPYNPGFSNPIFTSAFIHFSQRTMAVTVWSSHDIEPGRKSPSAVSRCNAHKFFTRICPPRPVLGISQLTPPQDPEFGLTYPEQTRGTAQRMGIQV